VNFNPDMSNLHDLYKSTERGKLLKPWIICYMTYCHVGAANICADLTNIKTSIVN